MGMDVAAVSKSETTGSRMRATQLSKILQLPSLSSVDVQTCAIALHRVGKVVTDILSFVALALASWARSLQMAAHV